METQTFDHISGHNTVIAALCEINLDDTSLEDLAVDNVLCKAL